MPKKVKRTVRTGGGQRYTRHERKPLDPIQIAAIVVGALVLAFLAWVIISNFTASKEPPLMIGDYQYESEPPMLINKNHKFTATVTMANGGEFVIELYPKKAPRTVNSFVFLAREGYFDGTTFHRVLEGFMAQGGDPTGSGMGGPGYQFINEPNDLKFDKAGVVAMANSGPDTNGSQFFITFAPTPHLDGGYTIFGQVIEGMNVVNAITRRNPDDNPAFQGDMIQTITITEK